MKIISLIPGATEMLCLLGLESDIVGRSHSCDMPSLSHLPVITRSIVDKDLPPREIDDVVTKAVREGRPLYQVDTDLLQELNPNLIVTQGICEVCAVSDQTVNKSLSSIQSFLPHKVKVISLSGMDFEGILKDLEHLGTATSKEVLAKELCEKLRKRWALMDAMKKYQKKVIFLEWTDPFFFGGHWVPEMIHVAGGTDLLGEIGMPSGRINQDVLLEKNPDVIIVGACGYGLSENIKLAKTFSENMKTLKAFQKSQIWAVNANDFCSRPTTRIVDGVTKLRCIFENKSAEGIFQVQ